MSVHRCLEWPLSTGRYSLTIYSVWPFQIGCYRPVQSGRIGWPYRVAVQSGRIGWPYRVAITECLRCYREPAKSVLTNKSCCCRAGGGEQIETCTNLAREGFANCNLCEDCTCGGHNCGNWTIICNTNNHHGQQTHVLTKRVYMLPSSSLKTSVACV